MEDYFNSTRVSWLILKQKTQIDQANIVDIVGKYVFMILDA